MSDVTAHHHALAVARNALEIASEKSEEANQHHNLLFARLADAKAKAALAVQSLRDGSISEDVAAVRMAAAKADAEDLNAAISAHEPQLAEATDAHSVAVQKANNAEVAANRAEALQAAVELDNQISQLEQTFLRAVAERYRLKVRLEGTKGGQTTFNMYVPCPALKALVVSNTPPQG